MRRLQPDSPAKDEGAAALGGLRRRGQFLISGLLWAAAGGFLIIISGYCLILYHYELSLAERFRASLGIAPPATGPDWFLLAVLASGPLGGAVVLGAVWSWYRRLWFRRVRQIWPQRRDRVAFSRFEHMPLRANEEQRRQRGKYLDALLVSDYWAPHAGPAAALPTEEARAEWMLTELEKDIAERALTTGLTVGLSHNRYIDLFTIFAAALELQLHVLSRLGKRPSWYAWRTLIQRCGASLFLNSYLNRQDSLALNLMIKKAGMGLQAAGDLMESAATHLSESDVDLDEALNLQHGGLLGMATKSLELGATMSLTVGQVGLHVIGNLIETVGDELTQGALAAGIIYYHGIALASDTLAIDRHHRHSPAMSRNVRDGIWKMGTIAGSILRDFVRERRTTFREKRRQIVRSLPRSAYSRIQALFGRRSEAG